MSGCYNAFGNPSDREFCEVEEDVCIAQGGTFNRDCWEKK
jgi:hypothetical protein